ncbi:MAG: DNA-binding protein [Oscillospiraceae bacterium]|nr:DNA-binding protein [Oscillospiraceae bacterium]
MDLNNMIPIAEYAKRIGKAAITVADKCRRGALPGAVKLGRDWFVPADAEYPDYRVKNGKYIDARKKK